MTDFNKVSLVLIGIVAIAILIKIYYSKIEERRILRKKLDQDIFKNGWARGYQKHHDNPPIEKNDLDAEILHVYMDESWNEFKKQIKQ